MADGITVRPYMPSDYDAVCALWHEAGWANPTPRELGEEPGGGVVFVAEREAEGSVEGIALWIMHGRRPMLRGLTVSEALRGHGVGAALLREIERSARASGHSRVELECFADNFDAIRLYHRAGWRRCVLHNVLRRIAHPILVWLGLRRRKKRRLELWSKRLVGG